MVTSLAKLTVPHLAASLRICGLCIAAIAAVTTSAFAQDGGVTHVDTVPAPSLRVNLVGDPAQRLATVYLPPGYSSHPRRRYPVVYLLHGFAADHRAFIRGAYQNLNIRVSMDSLIRAGLIRDMIVVTPNARTAYDGSFYANSPVTGNWEDFIVRDLVSFMDRRYRTVRSAKGRGIAGHSMGGYGALGIGMKNPGTFSSIYALSACCLSWGDDSLDSTAAARWRAVLAAVDRQSLGKAGFFPNLLVAVAAVYSPNPRRPPLFVDLPYRLSGDSLIVDTEVASLWRRGPLATVETNADNLRRMSIAFDAGAADGLRDIPINAAELDRMLTELRIPHEYEIYDGTHGSRIRSRIETRVLPFFSEKLRDIQ
ncbi:MAG: alpha/beta hydrolase-fold protein [Gemmatimonadaceae bacterium]